MGLKDLFTGRKKDDAACCGVQIVPDDEPQDAGQDQTAAAQAPTAEPADDSRS